MKTVILPVLAAASLTLILADAAAAQTSRGASSFLTRELNRAPPSAAQPTPGEITTRPAPQPAPQPGTPPGAQPGPASTTAPAVAPPAAAARPATPPVAAPALAPVPVAVSVAASAPPPAATAVEPAEPPASPPPTVLNAAALAALPFRVDLPAGVQITTGRPGPNFNIWTIRKGETALAMVYAGPASQFPIYDGRMVTAAGRNSIIVTEGDRRLAMEHLFQRTAAPVEIHVWVASVDGADRDLAERIAQTVDPK